MSEAADRIAWVRLPSVEEIAAKLPPGYPYDWGFVPAMARLNRAHWRIGQHFGSLFRAIMFEAGHLSRPEKEMVAAVAAAAQDCHY
ncbi:MAG: hypothetical protein DLM66_12595 [Candidatus Dormiibacter spiritus]|nr:MAG: hypothetical protein DLM66_12595 [Candidatus Dormibacteraeota bacterium]